jgi:hypothetical protein
MWKDDGTDEMKPPSRRRRSFARSGEWAVRRICTSAGVSRGRVPKNM